MTLYLGWSKFDSVVSLTLCGSYTPTVTPDTLVKSSPAWEFHFHFVSESITKVPCHFVGLVFTLSESNYILKKYHLSETQVYMVLKQSGEVST